MRALGVSRGKERGEPAPRSAAEYLPLAANASRFVRGRLTTDT